MTKAEAFDYIDKIRTDAQSAEAAGDPLRQWVTATNVLSPNSTLIGVPRAGNLWVNYNWIYGPPQIIEVQNKDGSTIPINVGENTISVKAGSYIYCQATDTVFIMIAYQMV